MQQKPISQFHLFTKRRFLPFFATQFLGALNDNIFKNALLVIIVSTAVAGADGSTNFTTNLAAGLFIVPYFLFCTTAGLLADKYDKALLIRRIKLAEIIIMLLGCYALWSMNISSMLVILFLLGTQSAFFGPIKYSIIPQHLDTHELLGGNAQVGMGTFVSILMGTLIGGWIVTFDNGPLFVGLVAVIVAIIGWLCSREIPDAAAENPDIVIQLNPIGQSRENFKLAKADPTVFYCILANSWFWLYGGSFLTQVPNFAVTVLNGHPTLISILLAAFIVGVAIGSLLCNKLSGGSVEPGLIPLGALGLTVFAVDLFFSANTFQLANQGVYAVLPSAFFGLAGGIRVGFDLMFIGLCGGLFIVPLYSMIQQRSASNVRARILSVNNICNAFYMVVGSLIGIVFLSILGCSIPQFFLAIALLNIIYLGFIFYRVPEFMQRFKIWISGGV
ncbi:MFS transporter [SAR92 clade bacterium H921]|nr:MFS transporter [SAR92 clade bacterium H921]